MMKNYDYITTKPELNEDLLMHYGVKGMKWKSRGKVSTSSKSKIEIYDKPIKVENKLNLTDKGYPRSHGKDSGSERENWVKYMIENKRKKRANKKGFTYIKSLRDVRRTGTRENLFTRKSKNGLPIKH